MRKFLTRITYFFIPLIPIFLIIAYAFVILFTSGENYKEVDTLIKSKKKYIIGYAYNEKNYKYLKWKSITENPKNSVIALGSSRVLQFRDNMFDVPFYNAGYTVSSINDFLPFMKSIPKNKYPDYLIIGLDQWMFNRNWDDLSKKKGSNISYQSFSYLPAKRVWKRVCKNILTGKVHYIYSNGSNGSNGRITKIGLNAHINNKGFRNDGSVSYGNEITKLILKDSTSNNYNHSSMYNRIKHGAQRFQYGETVNNEALDKLDRFLDFCVNNNIRVIAFLPPFSNKINAELESVGRHNYIGNIYLQSLKYFEAHGFELYDFQYLDDYGSDDIETIDGIHGGELTYLRLLICMLERNSALNEVADIKRLKADISHPLNRYIVYEY